MRSCCIDNVNYLMLVEFSAVTEVIQLMTNMGIMLHATFATCSF